MKISLINFIQFISDHEEDAKDLFLRFISIGKSYRIMKKFKRMNKTLTINQLIFLHINR